MTKVDEESLKNFKIGPNVQSLKPEEIQPYLTGLKERLSDLQAIFTDGDRYGLCPPCEEAVDSREDVALFLKELHTYLDCLSKKFLLQEKEHNPFSLAIDPTDSGFPHFRDLWFLNDDAEKAEERIGNLPYEDEVQIVESARDKIFRGDWPHAEQVAFVKLKYYEQLTNLKVLKDFNFHGATLLAEENQQRLYKINWSGLDHRTNIFSVFSMILTQDGSHRAFLDDRRHETLEATLEQVYRQRLLFIASAVDEISGLRPKLLKRYTVGPYLDCRTQNPKGADKLLALVPDAYILHFKVSFIASLETIRDRGRIRRMWKRIRGAKGSRELFSAEASQEYLLVPFRLQQTLGDKDEKDRPCRIFGKTERGEIVG